MPFIRKWNVAYFRDSSCQYHPGVEKSMPIKSWLDRAMMKYGGSYLDTDVEEVKTIGRIIVIFAILIPYWAIYFQVQLISFVYNSITVWRTTVSLKCNSISMFIKTIQSQFQDSLKETNWRVSLKGGINNFVCLKGQKILKTCPVLACRVDFVHKMWILICFCLKGEFWRIWSPETATTLKQRQHFLVQKI